MIFSSFLTHHPNSGPESAISSLVRICFSHLPSTPDSRGDISALRRSWKVFLGSKFAYSSSTFRKTKQLMVLATSEKVIPECEKNHHLAKIIVIAVHSSVTELYSRIHDSEQGLRSPKSYIFYFSRRPAPLVCEKT